MDFKLIQKLLDIKRVQVQMVRDRGYLIEKDDFFLTANINEFMDYIVQKQKQFTKSVSTKSLLSSFYKNENNESILVYYASRERQDQKQISVTVTQNFLKIVNKSNLKEAILIIDAPLSTDSKSNLKAQSTLKIQIFNENDLTFNPTLHVDTPRHELINDNELENLLKDMKVDISKLLIIKSTDPVVRYYGWSPGHVVRIHRNDSALSILAPKSINYRLIVN